MNNDDKFYKNIDFLKKEYKRNPKIVYKHVDDAVEKVRNYDKPLIAKKDREMLYIVCICIFMALTSLLGLFNPYAEEIISPLAMGISGIIFFIAGYFVNYAAKGFGIIFLFSHGMTGFCLMCGSIIGSILDVPIMHDNPTTVYIYLGILAVIAFASLITSIIINLSDKLRSVKNIKLYPLIGFAFVYFWLEILPIIIDKLYYISF